VSDINRLLDHIATAPSTEDALREALHINYADLEQQTVTLLRHEDIR
jgi:hypothetical protein